MSTTATDPNAPITTALEPITLIAQVLQHEMELTAEQIVFAYQKYKIPTTGLLVVVGYLGPSEQIAAKSFFDPATQEERQQSVFRHLVQIEIMSLAPDNAARLRKEEIALALGSFYCQQLQEKYQMGVAWLANEFVDATHVEETAMLNRYITTVAMTALHKKVKSAQYLDNFKVQLTAAQPGGRTSQIEVDPTQAPPGE